MFPWPPWIFLIFITFKLIRGFYWNVITTTKQSSIIETRDYNSRRSFKFIGLFNFTKHGRKFAYGVDSLRSDASRPVSLIGLCTFISTDTAAHSLSNTTRGMIRVSMCTETSLTWEMSLKLINLHNETDGYCQFLSFTKSLANSDQLGWTWHPLCKLEEAI